MVCTHIAIVSRSSAAVVIRLAEQTGHEIVKLTARKPVSAKPVGIDALETGDEPSTGSSILLRVCRIGIESEDRSGC